MIEFDILRLFCESKDNYNKYNSHINVTYLKTNFKELSRIYNIINIIYSKYDNISISQAELESAYVSNYPVLMDQDRTELTSLITRIFSSSASGDVMVSLLDSHRQRSLAGQIAVAAIDISEGRGSPEKLESLYEQLIAPQGDIGTGIEFVTDDLEELYSKTIAGPGIKWPLACLNKALGPLRKGNFGFIFARPEVGKTTFLSHFVTEACRVLVVAPSAGRSELSNPIIWFNNEQPGEEVKLRLFQSAFGISVKELFRDKAKYQDLYLQITGGLIKLVDNATIDRKTIEAVCKEHTPSLVIFDQIDKIQGFGDNERHDLSLGERYIWARELAKEYCPVIGVTQADVSGENIKYLTMANVANAKTAKQAEADWILGIGASQHDDFSMYRYFNISKNKLLGDEETDSGLRHGKFQVIIEPELGRYKEV